MQILSHLLRRLVVVVLLTTLTQAQVELATPYTVSTYAGDLERSGSYAGGNINGSLFNAPASIVVAANGDRYVADSLNFTIRKITPDGVVTTFAGKAGVSGFVDGDPSSARFKGILGLAIDAAGNLYAADTGNDAIRKISPSGVVSTLAGDGIAGFADGTGSAAKFNNPYDLCLMPNGDLLVADFTNNRIRRVTPGGVVTTYAGTGAPGAANGAASAATFDEPTSVACAADGNVYVADSDNAIIRRISPALVVSTFAGQANVVGSTNGLGGAARFSREIVGLALDTAGNLLVSDLDNEMLRQITPSGNVTSFAANLGIGVFDLFVTPDGVIHVADFLGHTVATIKNRTEFAFVAGSPQYAGARDGIGYSARFNSPVDMTRGPGGEIYVSDQNNHVIKRINLDGTVSVLAGSTLQTGDTDGQGAAARFRFPAGVCVDLDGNVYVADSSNHVIRKISPSGLVSTLAGVKGSSGYVDGPGSTAKFRGPWAVAADSTGNVYVTDTQNDVIRKISPAGVVSTLAGNAASRGLIDGTGAGATFNLPRGIVIDALGDLLVCDTNALRRVSSSGVVTTLAGANTPGYKDGPASAARFRALFDVDLTPAGDVILIDATGYALRYLDLSTLHVTTLAGSQSPTGVSTVTNGEGDKALFRGPVGVLGLPTGEILVADSLSHSIRRAALLPIISSDSVISSQVGQDFLYEVTTAFPATAFTVTNMPPGLNFSPLTRLISGRPVSVGTYAIQLNASNQLGTSEKTLTLTVGKGPAGITVAPSALVYNGTAQLPVISTTPSGLAYTTSITGNTGGAINAGTYAVNVAINDTNYSGNFSQNFTIAEAPQTINFPQPSDRVFGDAPFTPVATASSGLAISWTVVSGPATVGIINRSVMVTLTGTGIVTLRASQPGDPVSTGGGRGGGLPVDNYLAAPPVERSFSVSAAPLLAQTISLSSIANRVYNPVANSVSLSATSSSGLSPILFSVVSGPATVVGSTLTINSAGPITVRASQAGSSTYAAGSSEITFTVTKAGQSINFSSLTNRESTAPAFTLAASASSGLPVNFTVTGPATLGADGRTLSLTGAVGTVNVSAVQAGDDRYSAATTVTRSFSVTSIPQVAQTINFTQALPQKLVTDAPFLLAATASSGLPVTFSIVSGPATIGTDGKTVSVGSTAGTVVVRASQIGGVRDGITYAPASLERSFEVTLGPPSQTQTITFPQPANLSHGTPVVLSAISSSSLPVTFELASGPASIDVDGVTLRSTAPGKVVVRAVQPGNGTFKPAAAVTRTISVLPAAPAFPTTLSRTVAGRVDLDLRGINPTSGVTYSATGLPAGLKLDTKSGRLSGVITGKSGTYKITAYATASGLKSLPAVLNLTVSAFPTALIGSFEGLLTASGSGLPAGKLTLNVTATGAFTGTLVTPLPKTYPLKGNLSLNDAGTSATLTLPVAPYTLAVTLATTGTTPLAATLTQSGAARGNLTDGVRLAAYTGKAPSTAAWAAPAYTLALGDPRENLDLTSPRRPLPGGAGYATGSVDAKGLLKLSGKLADGRPFTAALAATNDARYRLYVQPYGTTALAVADNYLAGWMRLVRSSESPVRYRTLSSETGDVYWHKPRADKDPNYRPGFGPVALTARLATWIAPNAKAKAPLPTSLAAALALPTPPKDLPLTFSGGGLSSTQLTALPDFLRLDAKGLFNAQPTPAAKTWTFTLTPSTGKFTGSFVVTDPGATPTAKATTRKVSFEGVLLQLPTTEAAGRLGEGFYLVPSTIKGGAGEGGALRISRAP